MFLSVANGPPYVSGQVSSVNCHLFHRFFHSLFICERLLRKVLPASDCSPFVLCHNKLHDANIVEFEINAQL